MYLSRIQLNPTRSGTQRLLASRQRIHATVMGSFPPGSSVQSNEGRVLWRLDRDRESLALFVSSPSRPDFSGLIEQAGWPTSTAAWDTASMTTLLSGLTAGQRWRFRVALNPTQSVASGRGKRGRRVPHVTAEQQESWFSERAVTWGLSPDDLQVAVRDRGRDQFERRSDGASREVPVSYVTFDGALTVADATLLRHALGHGMGRAKAYGCGLMTLAPLS